MMKVGSRTRRSAIVARHDLGLAGHHRWLGDLDRARKDDEASFECLGFRTGRRRIDSLGHPLATSRGLSRRP